MSSEVSPLASIQSTIAPSEYALVVDPHWIAFLTSLHTLVPEEREAVLVIGRQEAHLFVTAFTPAPASLPPEITLHHSLRWNEVAAYLQTLKPSRLLFHPESMFHKEWQFLRDQLGDSLLTPHTYENWWPVRQTLTAATISKIKKACAITAESVDAVFSQLQPGMTELEIATQLRVLFLQKGAEDQAFPTIVACGANSALPHHQPSSRKLRENEAVLIDCGARYGGYCADMTRTIWFGDKRENEFKRIEELVQQAYASALAEVRRNDRARAGDLDRAARAPIEAALFGPQFIHTTGHGLGLQIHEPPSLHSANESLLLRPSVITIEPGIYLDGKFGYRYENTVLISDREAVELTNG